MKGRITYNDLPPLPSTMRRRTATFRMEIDMPPWRKAQLAQDFFGHDPVPHLVGHDPQRLLPAPEMIDFDGLKPAGVNFAKLYEGDRALAV